MSYGKLTVFMGPMFAGKTTHLLRQILWLRNGEGRTVLVVKPAFDDRYSTTAIVNHDGLSSPAESITRWSQVQELAEGAEVVCFDEVQFFQAPYFAGDILTIVRELLADGKSVIANGLDIDWQGHPFEITGQLAAMADEVSKLWATCTVCGKPAPKTFKKVANNETVELGATNLYEARCNHHWSYPCNTLHSSQISQ